MNGRSAFARISRVSGSGLRAAAPLTRAARPSMPGLRNSNSVHSSPRWFSTGVPLSASRWSALMSRTAFAVSVSAFLAACDSSSTQVSNRNAANSAASLRSVP